MRPVLGWAQYRTPIDGLFLCGAGTHPGGGLTAASGQNAAREIIPALKKRRAALRLTRLSHASHVRSRGDPRHRCSSPPRPGSASRCRRSDSPPPPPTPQDARERFFLAVPSADRIRETHRVLAGEPHLAGSPRDQRARRLRPRPVRGRRAGGDRDDARTTCCCPGRKRRRWRWSRREPGAPRCGRSRSTATRRRLRHRRAEQACPITPTPPPATSPRRVVYAGSGNPEDYDASRGDGHRRARGRSSSCAIRCRTAIAASRR